MLVPATLLAARLLSSSRDTSFSCSTVSGDHISSCYNTTAWAEANLQPCLCSSAPGMCHTYQQRTPTHHCSVDDLLNSEQTSTEQLSLWSVSGQFGRVWSFWHCLWSACLVLSSGHFHDGSSPTAEGWIILCPLSHHTHTHTPPDRLD